MLEIESVLLHSLLHLHYLLFNSVKDIFHFHLSIVLNGELWHHQWQWREFIDLNVRFRNVRRIELEVTRKSHDLFDSNDFHIISIRLDIIFEVHRSILVGNSSNGTLFFNRNQLSRRFQMLTFPQESVNTCLFGLSKLRVSKTGK